MHSGAVAQSGIPRPVQRAKLPPPTDPTEIRQLLRSVMASEQGPPAQQPRQPQLTHSRSWKYERKLEFTIKPDRLCITLDRILCPYLSVDFKKNEKTTSEAVFQVAVSSAIAVYNRYKLKQRRMQGQASAAGQYASQRHFGLVIAGGSYQFWCTTPQLDAQQAWAGCRMSLLFEAKCKAAANVRHLVDWVNEIHRWGLTVHGPECKEDVRHCLQQSDGGQRTALDAA
ncbi:uncharacterized protein LTHEOB_11890 [Neofusicoccum parvum]|nr:uncharacterized protein LTHEOB_11890 [Neofusicoccum parvum]